MAPQTTSSIAMALAGKTASVDIPKPRSGFVSGSHDATRPGHPTLLPTPPNSISPTLPPQAFQRRDANLHGSPPLPTSQLDSDIDLGDAAAHPDGQGLSHDAAAGLDSVGAITPEMLARHHLPEIMLQHGPLAIRHVTGFLTTSVPGFSRIPPAKARRLVVAALERGGQDETGEVIFEKVGWGRWDARRHGEPPRDLHHANESPPASFPSSYPRPGMQIPNKRDSLQPYGTSVTGDSAVFSYTEDPMLEDMLDHEADKMSLDGDGRDYCSSSEAPDDDIPDDDYREEDVTDEEDWAQIGADALRARSLNGGGGFINGKRPPSSQLRGGGPASSSLAKSAPLKAPIQQLGFSLPDGGERAAAEALLRLGSM